MWFLLGIPVLIFFYKLFSSKKNHNLNDEHCLVNIILQLFLRHISTEVTQFFSTLYKVLNVFVPVPFLPPYLK